MHSDGVAANNDGCEVEEDEKKSKSDEEFEGVEQVVEASVREILSDHNPLSPSSSAAEFLSPFPSPSSYILSPTSPKQDDDVMETVNTGQSFYSAPPGEEEPRTSPMKQSSVSFSPAEMEEEEEGGATRKGKSAAARRGFNRAISKKDVEEPTLDDMWPGLNDILIEQYGTLMNAWRNGFKQELTSSIKMTKLRSLLDDVVQNNITLADKFGCFSMDLNLEKDRGRALTLRDLCPTTMKNVDMFREFGADNFSNLGDFFLAMDKEIGSGGTLTRHEFVKGLERLNFEGDAHIVFDGLDSNQQGCVSPEEFAFLEQDLVRRSMVLSRIQGVETAAQLQIKQRLRRRKEQNLQIRIAHGQFLFHCIKKFGNLTRAWRTKLNRSGTMQVTEPEFLKFCVNIGFPGSARLAWRSMDKDKNGTTTLEELDMNGALMLAEFKDFLTNKYAHWQDFFADPTETKRSMFGASRKINEGEFKRKMKASGFKFRPPLTSRCFHQLFHALDLYGDGTITYRETLFLKKWMPPPWMSVDPDPRVVDTFKDHMLFVYGGYLSAWRQVLDYNGSNRVSWQEFFQACVKSRYKYVSEIPVIWRTLDEDLSGWISLKEIDEDEATMLETFLDWAMSHFGSVMLAFRALDADRSGGLSSQEFRAATRLYGYKGDAMRLFNALDYDRERVITVEKISFLDSWDLPDADEEERNQAMAMLKYQRTSAACHRKEEEEGKPEPSTWFPPLWCAKNDYELEVAKRFGAISSLRKEKSAPGLKVRLPPLKARIGDKTSLQPAYSPKIKSDSIRQIYGLSSDKALSTSTQSLSPLRLSDRKCSSSNNFSTRAKLENDIPSNRSTSKSMQGKDSSDTMPSLAPLPLVMKREDEVVTPSRAILDDYEDKPPPAASRPDGVTVKEIEGEKMNERSNLSTPRSQDSSKERRIPVVPNEHVSSLRVETTDVGQSTPPPSPKLVVKKKRKHVIKSLQSPSQRKSKVCPGTSTSTQGDDNEGEGQGFQYFPRSPSCIISAPMERIILPFTVSSLSPFEPRGWIEERENDIRQNMEKSTLTIHSHKSSEKRMRG